MSSRRTGLIVTTGNFQLEKWNKRQQAVEGLLPDNNGRFNISLGSKSANLQNRCNSTKNGIKYPG